MKTAKNQILIITGLLSLVMSVPALAQKISPSLQQAISQGAKGKEYICWVSLAGKPGSSHKNNLEKRSLDRRQKLGRALSYGDLPVSEKYIDAISKAGAKIRVISPWLNAVSIAASADQVLKLAQLSYVNRLDQVARFNAEDELKTAKPAGSKSLPSLDYGYSETQIKLLKINELHAKGYTGSGTRILIIDTGFDRQHEALVRTSVVAERDFQRMVHPLDENGDQDTLIWRPDSITSYEPDQDITRQQTQHGTGMLSIVGGYKSGSLIGSAYNADFVLAKTEKYYSYNGTTADISQEEDWFVAALQWGDSLGVDIATSSLGYRQWADTARASYTYSQMNGDVAFCSRAADSAVSRGIVVLNSNGNVNTNTRPDTCLIAPADGDSVIAVGGVWPGTGLWANPSVGGGACTGPAADSSMIQRFGGSDSVFIRRIKPDVAAAWQTAFANNMDTVNYSQILNGTGTSGAVVLTAGLCALLLEAHPTWGPKQVMEALKYSGSNRATIETFLAHPESLSTELGVYPNYNPAFSGIASDHKYYIDNAGTIYDFYDVYRIGWGIPDGVAALNYTAPEVVLPESDQLLEPYPNPAKPGDAGMYLPYFLTRDSYNVTIRIYTLDGRMLRQLDYGTQLAGEYPGQRQARQSLLPVTGGRPGGYWDLKDEKGKPAPSGLYLVILSTGWNQSVKKVVVIR